MEKNHSRQMEGKREGEKILKVGVLKVIFLGRMRGEMDEEK